MQTADIFQRGNLWIARVQTPYGIMEFFVGQGSQPNVQQLIFLETFLNSQVDHIKNIRSSVFSFPLLWRPIRLSVNNEGRMGLQFKNRITGKQVGMFFADEHSSFTTRLNEIEIDDNDINRLTKTLRTECDSSLSAEIGKIQ